MANDLERITIALEARTKSLETALNRANGIADKRARAIETRFARMSKSIEGSFSKLGAGAAQAFALIGGVAGLKNLTDSATKIDNALKVTGLSGEELTKVYDKLFQSAQKNSAPLEGLVTLYSRVALAQKDLGVTSEQIVGLTDNVGKALRLSGSSAAESSGALLQLSQALGGGVLQAEEYNSLIDGLPGLLQAAAAGIKEAGGSVSTLTRLVKDGKVTSKAFFDGIQAGAPLLDQKLSNSVQTIDQKMVNLGNSLLDAAHRFNSSSTAASTFGKEIDRTATYISQINFDTLITEIAKVITAFNNGVLAANRFFTSAGQSTGFDNIGKDIVNALGGEGGKATMFGGGLTISSSKIIEDRISGAFAEVDQEVSNLTSQAIIDAAKRNNLGPKAAPKGTRLPETASVKPVTLDDYKVPAKDKKKASSVKQTADSRFNSDIQAVRDRTAALIEEQKITGQTYIAQEQRRMALDLEQSALADLREEARKKGETDLSGIKLSEDQTKTIQETSVAYAEQADVLRRLQEGQELAKQNAEEFYDTFKSGALDAVTGAKSLGEAILDLGKKFADLVLSDAFDQLFKPSGGGGLFGGILSLFGGGQSGGGAGAGFALSGVKGFATGGRISGAGTGTSDSVPAMLSDGEFVVNAASTKQNRALLETINNGKVMRLAGGGAVRAPRMPNLSGMAPSAGSSVHVNFAPVLNAPNGDAAEIAGLRRELAIMKADMPAQVVKSVRNAQLRRML